MRGLELNPDFERFFEFPVSQEAQAQSGKCRDSTGWFVFSDHFMVRTANNKF